MSEDPAIYEMPINIRYLDIAVDYLRGLKYSFICEKYNCNNGYIQYALERAGVETNRIKSGARFNGTKKRQFSEELIKKMKENSKVNKRYDEKKRHLHCTMGNYLAEEDKNLQYEIVVTEEGEIKYDHR